MKEILEYWPLLEARKHGEATMTPARIILDKYFPSSFSEKIRTVNLHLYLLMLAH
jgi:hypothetical protein